MAQMSMPDRLLVLIRHSKSSWSTDDPDHARPLSGRGRRDGLVAGRWLVQRGLLPDLAVVSTSTRTRQTLERLTEGGARFERVVFSDEVYNAGEQGLLQLVKQADADVRTLCLIGHNPAIAKAVRLLARRVGNHEWWTSMDRKFPTSAIAVIGFDGPWSHVEPGLGALLAYVVPRD